MRLKNTEMVPAPKKGNLQYCNNWHGISLLATAGICFPELFSRGYKRLQTAFTSTVLGRGGVVVI